MSTVCHPPVTVVDTCRPLLQRWWLDLVAAWKAWRERVRERDTVRALEGLSRSTLQDIGMADRVPQRPTLSMIDYERGRW